MELLSADMGAQIRELIQRTLLGVSTCCPGIIDSFDPANQTCTVVPAIMMQVTIDDVVTQVELPPIVQAPLVGLHFATAKFAITGPVRKGDPCLLIFSQRAIDNWHLRGPEPQSTEEGSGCRHHDLTDAFVIMAPTPLPMVIGGYNETGIEIRSTDPGKAIRVTLDDNKIEALHTTSKFTITSSGVTVDAPTTFKKPVTFESTATLSTGVELTGHKHTDVQVGGSKSGGPTS